jgi:ribosomal protein L31E
VSEVASWASPGCHLVFVDFVLRLRLRHMSRLKSRAEGRCMEATRITVDEVKQRLDRGEEFAFIDTRNPQAWAESDKKLPHALRVPAAELNEHLEEIPKDRAVITYCT